MLPTNVRPLSSQGRARYVDDSMEQSVDEQALQPLVQAVAPDPQVGLGWQAAGQRLPGRLTGTDRSCAGWLQAWPEPERHIVISLETVRLTAALKEPCNLFVM